MIKRLYYYWYNFIREQLASFFRLITVYELSKKPIFIFATRRGGSTLMMKLIYSQPGVDYIDLPLNLLNYHPYKNKIPRPPMKNRFIHLKQDEEQMLIDYFNHLLEGRYMLRNQCNIFDPDFSFRVNRLVIRELMAKTLIDWFSKNFDIEIIYLLRHPIPTALSNIKFGWETTADAFLRNDYFCKNLLDEDKKTFGSNILKNGSPLEVYTMEWCLDNLYPLTVCKKRPWLTITYEELILHPKEMSNLICSRFDLPDPKHMYKTLLIPTSTAPRKSREDMHKKGQKYLIERWLSQMEQKDLKKIDTLLKTFEIKAYNAYTPYPAKELCHFGSLDG